MISVFTAKASDYIESFNITSDSCSNYVQDAQIIRPINGGTVIIPVFDESCPEEMKRPFIYACKIIEEYMPPCLPLKVSVACGSLKGSMTNAVSRVAALYEENFGNSALYRK